MNASEMSKNEPLPLFESNRRRVMKCLPALLLAGVSILFSTRIGEAVAIPGWAVAIAGLILGGGTYIAMARLFRCPSCASNLLIHAQFREPIGNWIETALAYKTCPRCGFRNGNL